MPRPPCSICGAVVDLDQCDECTHFFCRQHFFYFVSRGFVRCLCVGCNLATLSKLSADDRVQLRPFS